MRKKKLQKNKSTRTYRSIFSSIQNTCMPWGTSNNQIQVFSESLDFSLFFRGNSIFWNGALKKYGYVLIGSSKSKYSNLKRQKIWFSSKIFNQIPRNYEGWTCKGSPTVSPEVANSHQKMAHESPAFLRNQRQSRTAEITARLTGQLPRPPQLYFYNKGILKN